MKNNKALGMDGITMKLLQGRETVVKAMHLCYKDSTRYLKTWQNQQSSQYMKEKGIRKTLLTLKLKFIQC